MSRLSPLIRTTVCACAWFTAVALCLAATLVQANETTNKIGITMVDIPSGSFLMGSCKVTAVMEKENRKRAFLGKSWLTANCEHAEVSEASDVETPQHRVTVRAFQMSKTEVTVGQFKQFIAATGRSNLVNSEFMKSNDYGDNTPVVQVSWEDAQAFIGWLNKTDGRGYRLPSEAEWEYACRAGGRDNHCGSDNVDAIAWSKENSSGHQHTVGNKQANAFGLYDMSGNAWEWVQDCWHDSYLGAPNNGKAWTTKCKGDVRGLRGGSWSGETWLSRSASRSYNTRSNRNSALGFRLVRTR
ncbi:formylglycine-generating enzyme [Gammaproteobacteria bacterium]